MLLQGNQRGLRKLIREVGGVDPCPALCSVQKGWAAAGSSRRVQQGWAYRAGDGVQLGRATTSNQVRCSDQGKVGRLAELTVRAGPATGPGRSWCFDLANKTWFEACILPLLVVLPSGWHHRHLRHRRLAQHQPHFLLCVHTCHPDEPHPVHGAQGGCTQVGPSQGHGTRGR